MVSPVRFDGAERSRLTRSVGANSGQQNLPAGDHFVYARSSSSIERIKIRVLNIIFAAALAAAPLALAHGTAEDEGAALAVVNTFLSGFNSGDEPKMLAACASQMTIIDDIPPHIWQGPTACRQWKKAVDAFLKETGETHVTVTLGTPSHNDVTGDRAYIVAPLTFKYMQSRKPVVDTGSQMIVSLQKRAAGWRMTGWACAEHP
jgi:hypothetical protein